MSAPRRKARATHPARFRGCNRAWVRAERGRIKPVRTPHEQQSSRSRILRACTLGAGAVATVWLLSGVTAALAQSGPTGGGAGGGSNPSAELGGAGGVSIWALFRQSFDLFTILIVTGSIASVAIIVRSAIVVRRPVVLPIESTSAIRTLVAERRWPDLQRYVADDLSFVGRVLHETLPKVKPAAVSGGGAAVREAAEIAADNESLRRFKEIELLGVLGNLGPLLGLVGTVWGMIIAFTAIGETGGQAAAAQLSTGIAKALFHTFLGLTLAIPSLLAFGVFRERLDRLCAEGTMLATDATDAITATLLNPSAMGTPAPVAPGAPTSAQPAPRAATSPTTA